jgi:hypothetical protein
LLTYLIKGSVTLLTYFCGVTYLSLIGFWAFGASGLLIGTNDISETLDVSCNFGFGFCFLTDCLEDYRASSSGGTAIVLIERLRM